MNDSQNRSGCFGARLKPGEPLARQRGLCEKVDKLAAVLEGLMGIGGIKIHKTDDPTKWMISFSGGSGGGGEELPEGFEVVEKAVVDLRWLDPDHEEGSSGKYELQMKRGKVLAANVDEEWDTLLEFKEYDA